MEKLAIKGHQKRGKEVIEILEMLGGKNYYNFTGGFSNNVYFINENEFIFNDYYITNNLNYFQISLEEFLEKYPYKVGNWVLYKHDNKKYLIRKMFWKNDKVLYELSDGIIIIPDVDVTKLQSHKEESVDETNKVMFEANLNKDNIKTITIDDFKANTKEWLIDKLHNMIISDSIRTIGNLHDELFKPKYPRTYKECCEILGCKSIVAFAGLDDDEENLYGKFIALKRCRDAYWKIAGEQMGLDKPWEPDWTDNYRKWTINFYQGEINLTNGPNVHFILAFPTEEMRDAFYENFKNLINSCKELL